MVEGKVRGHGAAFRLEHDGRLRRGDLPQQAELLVSQRTAGRVVPELKVPAAHFTDAVRVLEPDVAGKGVRADGSWVNVEDRHTFAGDPWVLSPAARLADDTVRARRLRVGDTKDMPDDMPNPYRARLKLTPPPLGVTWQSES
jgi:hypothetical protein